MQKTSVVRALNQPKLAQRLLAVCIVGAVSLFAREAAAQAQPAPTSTPPARAEEPVSFETAGNAAPAAAPSVAPPATDAMARAQATTQKLLELEARAKQLEQERSKVRFIGLRVGKYVSWTAFGVLLGGALSAWGNANLVQEALDDKRTDKAYDTDGDGDVDRADKRHSQRIARALIGVSIVPLGTGIFSTVLDRMRQRKVRQIDAELTDLRDRRRGFLDRLGVDLGLTRREASLRLRVAL